MIGFVLGRLIEAIVTLVAVSLIVFVLGRATGNPVDLLLPTDATPEQHAAIEERLGLHDPYPVQYVLFVRDAFTNGFGTSVRNPGKSALDVIEARTGNTIKLAGAAVLLTAAMFLPLGIIAALTRGSWLDLSIRSGATVVQAAPSFLVAILAIRIFAVELGWFPTSGLGNKELILPAFTLSLAALPGLVRLLRSSMLASLGSDYVRFARLKGLSPWTVITKHALRNALIAPLTYFGTLAAVFLTGTVITETVFAWPGLGSLAVTSVQSRDFPVVQAIVLLFAAVYISIQFVVDVAYALLDPRIRYWES